jgi:hypothetical protein
MNYRLLGNSGLRVSEVALGTMTFGTDWGWGADRGDARKMTKLSIIANPVREKQGPVKSTTSIQVASAANQKTVGFLNNESLLSSDLDGHFLLT